MQSQKSSKSILFFQNSKITKSSFRRELIEALLAKSFKVILLTPIGGDEGFYIELGCLYISININRHGTNLYQDCVLSLNILKIINKIKPDICLTYTVKPNLYGGIACSINRIPQIANITGLGIAVKNSGWLQKFILVLTKLSLKKTEVIFFQNEENKLYYEKLKIVDESRSRLIPGSGVNLDKFYFHEYPPQNKEKVKLLYVGRIMKDKGIDELIEASKIVHKKHPNFHCDFVGPFENENYKMALEEYEKTGAGKYLGVSKAIHALVRKYHAIILPSHHEGMSNALLEAAASGRPVLASLVSGCREAFEDGKSGIGFEAKSVNSIVEAIEKFIYLPYEIKKEMGIKGRAKMEKEFDRQIVVDAYLSQINNILTKN